VYFGQTAATSKTSLATLCADRNIDIAILAFVVSRNDSGGPYPRVNFGAACGGQTPLMVQKAPGLLSCPELAADIETCQKVYGKKVLLSIGGSSGSIMFNTKSEASAFGGIIWDLFGPQGKIDLDLRPFGSVSIDGFDIGRFLASI
jgi:chitinase